MNGNNTSVLPFFLAGLTSGITLTLLLAPRSGSETRNILGRKMKEGEAWVKEKASKAEDFASAGAKDLRERAENLTESLA